MEAFTQLHASSGSTLRPDANPFIPPAAHANGKRPLSRNKQWVAGGDNTNQHQHQHSAFSNGHAHAPTGNWRGGAAGGGGRGTRGGATTTMSRGTRNKVFRPPRGGPSTSAGTSNTTTGAPSTEQDQADGEEATDVETEDDNEGDDPNSTPEERERFYQDLVKARELERKKAIAEGKMDDPNVPKRLEDAITIVGTCMDMCPRFERYRRERENNLFEWETIPGTKRVNHKRAVKMYERAAGDKIIPSDLRPPEVLKKTLDYLFHDLIPREGFSRTFSFVRDRSRAVRNDFTMQHETGKLAIECHDRCVRFHILALHHERGRKDFSVALEEQQLMYTLQSLKEFYEDQRGRYTSPTELEMRVYHRLIHIRDQRERHEDIPSHITQDPVFQLTTQFRLHVQNISSPITKTSVLKVDEEGMRIFGELAERLRAGGGVVMIYLVACILERLFGEVVEGIEGIRGALRIRDVIDGVRLDVDAECEEGEDEEMEEEQPSHQPLTNGFLPASASAPPAAPAQAPAIQSNANAFSIPSSASAFSNLASTTTPAPSTNAFTTTTTTAAPSGGSAFSNLSTTVNAFGSVFGTPAFGATVQSQPQGQGQPKSVFGTSFSTPNVFGGGGAAGFGASSSVPVFGVGVGGSGVGQGEAGEPTNPSTTLPSTTSSSFPPASAIAGFPAAAGGQQQQQKSIFGGGGATAFGTSASTPAFGQPSSGFGATTNEPLPSPFLKPGETQQQQFTFTASQSVPSSLFPGSSNPFGGTTPQTQQQQQEQQPESSPAPSSARKKSISSSTIFPPGPSSSSSLPSRLTINTSSLLSPGGPQSPMGRTPPPAPKPEPISLPMTPSMLATPAPALPTAFSHRADLFKGGPGSPFLGVGTGDNGPLSPLVLSSPSVSRMPSLANFGGMTPTINTTRGLERKGSWPTPAVSPSPSMGSGSMSPRKESFAAAAAGFPSSRTFPGALAGLDKGKGVAVFPQASSSSTSLSSLEEGGDVERQTEMEAKAKAFSEKLMKKRVKMCFGTWVEKATRHAAWVEACEHSEAYSRKRRERKASASASVNGVNGKGKRRRSGAFPTTVSEDEGDYDDEGIRASASASTTSSFGGSSKSGINRMKRPSPPKRTRRSTQYRPPITDEKLVERLKQNREENERRWAQGSFLDAIKTHVKTHTATPDAPTLKRSAWLSMNPHNDRTAIWMERKFAVPDSGTWKSECVFEIPLDGNDTAATTVGMEVAPLILVFECTPSPGNDEDDIERKLRVLDDCARLRDVIKVLPTRRAFNPALLIVSWSSSLELEAELSEMVDKAISGQSIESYRVLLASVEATNLDNELVKTLGQLPIDLSAKLAQFVTVRRAFKLFDAPFDAFVQESISRCTGIDDFYWSLFASVIRACVELLNYIAGSVQLVTCIERQVDLLHDVDMNDVEDDDSMFDAAVSWLDTCDVDEARDIQADLRSHQMLGRGFPQQSFIERLRDCLIRQAELSASPVATYPILKTELTTVMEDFQVQIQAKTQHLREVFSASVRISPKRRSLSSVTESISFNSLKRRRPPSASGSPPPSISTPMLSVSPPNDSVRDAFSPERSVSAMSTTSQEDSKPLVTSAMLRSLTRSVRMKYSTSDNGAS